MSIYGLNNLPPGFEYDSITHRLTSPGKKAVVVNPDGSVTNTRNFTFDSVNQYVQLNLSVMTDAHENRDRMSEFFRADEEKYFRLLFPRVIQKNWGTFSKVITLIALAALLNWVIFGALYLVGVTHYKYMCLASGIVGAGAVTLSVAPCVLYLKRKRNSSATTGVHRNLEIRTLEDFKKVSTDLTLQLHEGKISPETFARKMREVTKLYEGSIKYE